MSMSMKISTVSDTDIEEIKAIPEKLEIIHYGEIFEEDLEDLDLDEKEKKELLEWKPKHQSLFFHIAASFEAINYLLTEDPVWGNGVFPLNFLGEQGIPIGEIGWGPARFFSSKETQEIYDRLKILDIEKISAFYNVDNFNKYHIYPKGYIWTDTDIEKLISKIRGLVEFISEAKNGELGIYITIE